MNRVFRMALGASALLLLVMAFTGSFAAQQTGPGPDTSNLTKHLRWASIGPNIIWVGTGEECVRNSIAWGDGVYKSTDGGKSFTRMGLETTQTIARVVTHPSDPGIVYVGASGHPWGYTGDRGLFKTTDGGLSWTKLAGGLPHDGKTGVIDLVMHPTDPETLYASFWPRLPPPR